MVSRIESVEHGTTASKPTTGARTMAKSDERHAKNGARYHVRALERALDILQVFSLEKPERSLTDLVEQVGLAKSTVIRLLAVLESNGLVERSEWSDRYR